ncbi:MAG: response regulator transcription factor [Cytophagaceae bacterium]|nr:response regulator transcription factor [Cytophagaceae bacterium]
MKVLAISISYQDTSFSSIFGKEVDFTLEWSISRADTSDKIHLYEYDCILIFTGSNHQEAQEIILESGKTNKSSGLILLAPEITVAQKVNALNAGADDCLTIPIHPDELKARILAIIRRKKFNTQHQIRFANIIVDLEQKQVAVWNTPVALTPKEYEILIYLIMNQKKTVSSTMLAEYLWGEESEEKESNNPLIAHIKNLRKKLTLAKAELEIKNIYAVGYQIIEL